MEFWKFDSNVVSKNMLALQSYEQNNGFSAMSVDELYFINGGSEIKLPTSLVLPSYESKPRENGTTINYNGITKDFSIEVSGSIQKPSVTLSVTIYFN